MNIGDVINFQISGEKGRGRIIMIYPNGYLLELLFPFSDFLTGQSIKVYKKEALPS